MCKKLEDARRRNDVRPLFTSGDDRKPFGSIPSPPLVYASRPSRGSWGGGDDFKWPYKSFDWYFNARYATKKFKK